MFLRFSPHVPALLPACSCSSVRVYLHFCLYVPALPSAFICVSLRMYLRFSPHVPVLLSPCSCFDTAIRISVFYKLNFSFPIYKANICTFNVHKNKVRCLPLYVSPELLHLQGICIPKFTIQSSTIHYSNSAYHSDFCNYI